MGWNITLTSGAIKKTLTFFVREEGEQEMMEGKMDIEKRLVIYSGIISNMAVL
jgi:hypothetical protein